MTDFFKRPAWSPLTYMSSLNMTDCLTRPGSRPALCNRNGVVLNPSSESFKSPAMSTRVNIGLAAASASVMSSSERTFDMPVARFSWAQNGKDGRGWMRRCYVIVQGRWLLSINAEGCASMEASVEHPPPTLLSLSPSLPLSPFPSIPSPFA